MSALLKSPGMFDFLRPALAQIAPLLPGPWGSIAQRAGSLLGGGTLAAFGSGVATDLLISRPSQMVGSTMPPDVVPEDEDEEEVDEESFLTEESGTAEEQSQLREIVGLFREEPAIRRHRF